MANAWMLQANPNKWRVWDWHEAGAAAEPLTRWTVYNYKQPVQVGDDFALWLSGPGRGVCAIGKITAAPYGPEISPSIYWTEPPTEPSWGVGIEVTRRFFAPVISATELAGDPGFADALILKMPQAANPIRLSPAQWATIVAHAPSQESQGPTVYGGAAAPGTPITTLRPLGAVPADGEQVLADGPSGKTYAEAALLVEYQMFLGRPLLVPQVVLADEQPSVRLIGDAYDGETGTLIEAKSSAGREKVRMAIGQLLDYRRHIQHVSRCAILLPERPSNDLVSLISGSGMELVYRDGAGFVTEVP
jgi:hypothetical protein